jgi:hypothetical protein
MVILDSSDSDNEYEQCQLLMLQCVTLITIAASAAAITYSLPHYDRILYHTSALTGAG